MAVEVTQMSLAEAKAALAKLEKAWASGVDSASFRSGESVKYVARYEMEKVMRSLNAHIAKLEGTAKKATGVFKLTYGGSGF